MILKVIIKSSILNAFIQLTSLVYPIILITLLVKILSIENYGKFALITSYLSLALIFTEFGYSNHGIKVISECLNGDEIKSEFYLIIKSKLILTGVAFPIYIAIVVNQFYGEINLSVLIVSYLFVLGFTLNPTWYFIATNKLKNVAVSSFIIRIITLLLIYLLVKKQEDLSKAIVISSFGVLLIGLSGYLLANRDMKNHLYKKAKLNDVLRSLNECKHLMVSNIGITLYTSINVILINNICGSVQAGYFSIAEKIIKATQQVLSSISISSIPIIIKKINNKNSFNIYKILKIETLIFLFAAIVIYISGPFVVEIIVGELNLITINLIRIMSAIVFVGGLSSAIYLQVLLVNGYYRDMSKFILLAGILNILISIVLTNLIGVYGAAISVVITEAIIFISMLVYLRKLKIVL